MRKGRLLASVCALGLFAAAPVFAAGTNNSSDTATGAGTSTMSGTGGSPMGPSSGGAGMSTGMQGSSMSGNANSGAGPSTTTGMNGSGSMGTGSQGASTMSGTGGNTNGASTDHSSMTGSNDNMNNATHRSRQSMRQRHSGQTDTSQNAEVDRLNEQSLQAAQQGHSFDVGNAGGSNTMSGTGGGSPSGKGRM